LLDDGVAAMLIINVSAGGVRFVLGSAFVACCILVVIRQHTEVKEKTVKPTAIKKQQKTRLSTKQTLSQQQAKNQYKKMQSTPLISTTTSRLGRSFCLQIGN
jgi:hypothetical protein